MIFVGVNTVNSAISPGLQRLVDNATRPYSDIFGINSNPKSTLHRVLSNFSHTKSAGASTGLLTLMGSFSAMSRGTHVLKQLIAGGLSSLGFFLLDYFLKPSNVSTDQPPRPRREDGQGGASLDAGVSSPKDFVLAA